MKVLFCWSVATIISTMIIVVMNPGLLTSFFIGLLFGIAGTSIGLIWRDK